MFHRILIAAALLAGTPLAAAPREAAVAAERPVVAVSGLMLTLGERGTWGLILGVAILGLTLRRRRRGPVVTS